MAHSHGIKHGEELARNALYQVLFNAGFQALAFLAILLVILIFLTRQAW